MRRILIAIGTFAVVSLAACSDRGALAPNVNVAPRYTLDPNAVPCTAPDLIDDLIIDYFGAGSPDANSALSKWSSIQKQKTDGNTTEVVSKTWNLIDFLLTKQQQNKLPANETYELLGRALFCFAGIDATLPRTPNAWIVNPGDLERTLVTEDGFAGVKLSGQNVNETSLISIVPSTVPLRTNLDQYPVVYEFSKYPSNVFVEDVVAAVCSEIPVNVPDAVLDRMVLGHNKGATDFELLPKVAVDFLNCAPLLTSSAPKSLTGKLLAMLLPTNLYAFGPGASGIGGTLLEFSPIGPVDPRVNVTPNAASTSAPIGSLLLTPPAVTLTTPNGTTIVGASAGFAVTSGGGIIAPTTATTNALGTAASTSWRLGTTTGTNTATATPTVDGTVLVTGVLFNPAITTFTAQATAPTGIEITGGPVAATTYTAGSTLPSATIRVIGEGNRTVEGYTGAITVSATQGGPLFGTASRNATLGEATFADLSIQKAGATQQLKFDAGLLTANTGIFSIGFASAASLVINAGNNQTAPFGSVLGTTAGTTAPSVLVRDAYGNAVNGAAVYFTPTAATTKTGTTNASGIASTTWTLQAGPNELLASLDATPTTNESRFKLFSATGTTTSAQIISCTPGNQKDPIGSYAVRVDGVNKRVTDATFYLSITGSANALTPYDMVVTARTYSSQNILTSTVTSNVSRVFLRGSASEQKEANFFFSSGVTSGNNTKIVFTIAPAPTQAVSGTINFNAGNCAPGSTRCVAQSNPCRAANEVPINTPLGTVFRQSPAVKLLGF